METRCCGSSRDLTLPWKGRVGAHGDERRANSVLGARRGGVALQQPPTPPIHPTPPPAARLREERKLAAFGDPPLPGEGGPSSWRCRPSNETPSAPQTVPGGRS